MRNPTSGDADNIQFSILENAFDFIVSGLKHISSPVSKFDLKYAVLHLSAGIELVLKDRLMREDWRQIFVKPEDATEEKLRLGNFRSVTLEQCLERLDKYCLVDLPDRALLLSFKHLRNPIEHFALDHSRDALEASSAVVLGGLIDFIGGAYVEETISLDESVLLQQIRASLAEFQRFTLDRMTDIAPLLEEHKKLYGQIIPCPLCLQDALMADAEVGCAFCAYTASSADAAELYIANTIGTSRYYCMKEGDTYPLRKCPNCESEALVFENGYAETPSICFACGHMSSPDEYSSCYQCQELYYSEDDSCGLCSECLSAYLNQDNS